MDWTRYGTALEELGVYGGGIIAYTLVMALFYERLSKRDMFGNGKGGAQAAGRALAYVSIFPLLSFGFFLALAVAFLFLTPNEAPAHAFLLAMAIVVAVRVCAYVSEGAAHELAKLLPLGMLGVFLVTFEYDGLKQSVEALEGIYKEWDIVAAYFAVLVLLEFLLRGVRALTRPKAPADKRATARPATAPAMATFQRKA